MTPEQISTLILSIFGFLVQLLLRYGGKFAEWYQASSYKGLIAVGMDVLIGLALFGLSCWPVAVDVLKLNLVCSSEGFGLVLSAIVTVFLAQQGSYLVLPKPKKS